MNWHLALESWNEDTEYIRRSAALFIELAGIKTDEMEDGSNIEKRLETYRQPREA